MEYIISRQGSGIIWIMHGVAGNSRKYWPMWHHCIPRVKTEYVLLPEAKPRAIMLMRSSPEGYSDVTEVNIFYYWPATACIIHFITWQASLPAFKKIIVSSYFSWLLSQILLHEQLTIARCHDGTDVSRVLLIRRSPVYSQKYHIPSLHRSHVIMYLFSCTCQQTWHILKKVDHLMIVGLMSSSWLLLI